MYRFAVLLLLLVLAASTVYGNLTHTMEYRVYQLPQSCWQDYSSVGGYP